MSTEVAQQDFVHAPACPPGRHSPAWKHNPLHDLESVWWISVWVTYVFMEGRERTPADTARFNNLFPPSGPGRRDIATTNHASLQRSYSPSYNQPIWSIIVEWRASLTESFKSFQSTFNEEPTLDLCLETNSDAINRIKTILALDSSVLDAPLTRSRGL